MLIFKFYKTGGMFKESFILSIISVVTACLILELFLREDKNFCLFTIQRLSCEDVSRYVSVNVGFDGKISWGGCWESIMVLKFA